MRELTNKRAAKRILLEQIQMPKNFIFIGNFKVKDLPKKIEHIKELSTLKIGFQSYDITGKPLNRANYRPLFINKKDFDAYNKIMETKNKK